MKAKIDKKKLIIVLCVLGLLYAAAIAVFGVIFIKVYPYCFGEENARMMLPVSATEVHEHTWNIIFPPDFCYFLKAKIDKDEFEAFKKKLKFIPAPEDKRKWLGYKFSDIKKKWWDPCDTSEGTFYDPNPSNSQKAYMKYENGYVYYVESAGM